MIEVTENLTMGNLISRREPFMVPIYQRSYAWESEEIGDFIEDLKSIYRIRLENRNKPINHFFGGLVSVHQKVAATVSGRRYVIVDGQQRLATFVMTFSLVVDALETLSTQAKQEGLPGIEQDAKAHAEHTRNNFLKYDEVEAGRLVSRLRLALSRADNQFFEKLLEGNAPQSTRDSHKRIEAARDTIKKELIDSILTDSSLNTKAKLENLLQLLWCLTDGCFAIHIVSDDLNEAYRLFKILNDRGRNLTDGDLLRSHTLELLQGHPTRQQRVENHWDEILSGKPSDIDQFLRSYYTSHVGERAPARDLFDAFARHFFKLVAPALNDTDAALVEKAVSDMRVEHEVFSKINIGEWPYEDGKCSNWDKDRLSRLINVLGHTLSVPLLLSAHSKLTEDKFSEVVDMLERTAFRYVTIVGAHPGNLSKKYYAHAKAIRGAATYNVSQLLTDLQTILTAYAPEELFKANLKGKLNYSGSSAQKRIIRHFLTTLEDHYDWYKKGGSGYPRPSKMRVFDLNQTTIEHIYPQNPSTPEAMLEPFKHDIGNLAFWAPGDNSSAGNEPFQSKKDKYATSSVKLTRDLATLTVWSEAVLASRRTTLIDMATKVFRV